MRGYQRRLRDWDWKAVVQGYIAVEGSTPIQALLEHCNRKVQKFQDRPDRQDTLARWRSWAEALQAIEKIA